ARLVDDIFDLKAQELLPGVAVNLPGFLIRLEDLKRLGVHVHDRLAGLLEEDPPEFPSLALLGQVPQDADDMVATSHRHQPEVERAGKLRPVLPAVDVGIALVVAGLFQDSPDLRNRRPVALVDDVPDVQAEELLASVAVELPRLRVRLEEALGG